MELEYQQIFESKLF